MICRECGGRKIVRGHSIIDRICPVCHGRGRKDWITYAMGGKNPYEPPNYQFLHKLVMRNIQILVNEIHIQALELGISADVNVELNDRSGYISQYQFNSIEAPTIKKLLKIKGP
jgi:hypothetical protein